MRKIVARYRDGTILKGDSDDFSPDRQTFHLHVIDGEVVVIDINDLKAIFFVKDHEGNKDRKDKYKDARPWSGKRVRVVFSDGEEIIGYTSHHSFEQQGFFITPADLENNNEDIFVITSATRSIDF